MRIMKYVTTLTAHLDDRGSVSKLLYFHLFLNNEHVWIYFQSLDGVEHLHIPIDEGTLKEFIDEHTDN